MMNLSFLSIMLKYCHTASITSLPFDGLSENLKKVIKTKSNLYFLMLCKDDANSLNLRHAFILRIVASITPTLHLMPNGASPYAMKLSSVWGHVMNVVQHYLSPDYFVTKAIKLLPKTINTEIRSKGDFALLTLSCERTLNIFNKIRDVFFEIIIRRIYGHRLLLKISPLMSSIQPRVDCLILNNSIREES